MPDFCSCGAQLPEDAVFCHKCGKPQREIAAAEPEAPPRAETPAPDTARVYAPDTRLEAPAINFQNAVAWRIAGLVSLAASALFFLPYVNWLAAGYFSVFLYRRKTGRAVNVISGVRIGWMTGLLMFAILAVFFAGFVLMYNADGMRELFQAQFGKDPRMQQMLTMIQSVPDVLGTLLTIFLCTTFLSMAGGALGAKLVGEPNPPRGGRIA